MDRCALFVDAGYVLSDGAMAVHGTRHRDSVSWDYASLLKLLASLSRDRTGLPLLRCYWYEATVDSRRTAEHEALAELPGLKLRMGKMRPGRREGVEAEIHRDLTTLARNRAISDAVIVSAEEDLAQVIADAQDLGVRVAIVHITVDGSWTISRMLRQEADDIVEISGSHLRPFVDLIPGAEPRADEQYAGPPYQAQSLPGGRSQPAAAVTRQGLPAAALPAPATIYNTPVAADYQSAGQPLAAAGPQASSRSAQAGPGGTQSGSRQEPDIPGSGYVPHMPAHGVTGSQASGSAQARRDDVSLMNGQQAYPQEQLRSPAPSSPQSSLPQTSLPQDGLPGNGLPRIGPSQGALPQDGLPQDSMQRNDASRGGLPDGLPQNGLPRNGRSQGVPQQNGLPQNGGLPLPQNGLPQNGQAGAGARSGGLPRQPASGSGQQYPQAPGGQFGVGDQRSHGSFSGGHQVPRGSAGQPAGFHASGQDPYIGQQPAAGHPPAQQPVNVSLADAVQSAHVEGFGFGEGVARDAPALWLEAVLARKPRMPSDLEARLLQGSALPIDSLLHDEVRHALRRGFWDALERSRR